MQQLLQPADILTVNCTLIAVLLPLIAFAINLLLPGRQNKLAGWVSSGAVLAGTIAASVVFARVWNNPEVHPQLHWFVVGNTQIDAGILLNNLSVLMLLLVNVIALPVHIYSIAYMGHDDNPKRYFTWLSFFCFSMLALVVADNLLLFYVFWELVGFSSYLLIGFWFTRDMAVFANKKAFIINRIGDIGLLSAIIILFNQFHTFDINVLFSHQNGLLITNHGKWITAAGSSTALLQHIAFAGIFLAVAAKSAQFPLHTWLPDAMEGPTSISALIHAATMVAAGVFLLARVYPLFSEKELTLLVLVGCFTAFFAATSALAQNDLKRILAYSTISQLGYMVTAMGVGAYSLSIFHLAAHAFFKCLLFLIAGVVIHEMSRLKSATGQDFDPQDIRNMGDLRERLPLVFIIAVIAAAALIGLPLTSAFLSKDGILIQTFSWAQGKSSIFLVIPITAVVTTWLTGFYVIRMMIKVFCGDARVPGLNNNAVAPASVNWLYKIPMLFLAVCCFFPLFSRHPLLFERSWIFKGFFNRQYIGTGGIYNIGVPFVVNIGSLAVIVYAWLLYSGKLRSWWPEKSLLTDFFNRGWYFDDIYNTAIVKPLLLISRSCFWIDRRVIDGFLVFFAGMALALSRLAAFTDRRIIDGFINLLTGTIRGAGDLVRRLQAGKVQYYLYSMLVAMLTIFILKMFF